MGKKTKFRKNWGKKEKLKEEKKEDKKVVMDTKDFIRMHPTETDLLLENPVFNFLVDKLNEYIVLSTHDLLYEKDLNEVRNIQGQIIGRKMDIEYINDIKTIRNKGL